MFFPAAAMGWKETAPGAKIKPEVHLGDDAGDIGAGGVVVLGVAFEADLVVEKRGAGTNLPS